ncbi:leucine-rich repeat extensin-like protein 5 [Setaria italica]|uniref:leucine-rich repeat extensin-like protein 5 n=1 Tax=Setaria italica TaxID=4555 RepID=UPI000350F03C|nr:leucine-rich repeat extensin-like protein 5 [Setaria italica]
MERPLRHLALLLGLLAWAAAAATGAAAQPACEPSNLATQITLFCMPDMPTAPCCEPVVASVDLGGGVPCLCRVAAQPQLVLARLNASHLLALYTACGGLRTGGAHLAAACQGPSPPATVPVIAPPPPAAPRHRLPARGEAPPPPATSEKPSPPPQQQPGAAAAHGKAIPASPAASSPLAPAAAPTTPTPPTSGSDGRCSCTPVILFLLTAIIVLY